jgi:hypothetical protein
METIKYLFMLLISGAGLCAGWLFFMYLMFQLFSPETFDEEQKK